MKTILVIAIFVMHTLSFAQSNERTLRTSYGDIDIESLEKALSDEIGAEVKELAFFTSYNPLIRLGVTLSKDLTANRATFTLNQAHDFSCVLAISRDSLEIYFTLCRSKNVELLNSHRISILPLLNQPN